MKMDDTACADMFAEKLPDGKRILFEHTDYFGGLLMHILVGEMINYPLTKLLKENGSPEQIKLYCEVIEEMWRSGDSSVINVMEVSILEYLTDDPVVWQRFGKYISKEFRWHINDESIPNNLHYLNAEKLEG